MTYFAQITINGKTQTGLSSRLRYLLEARRIRALRHGERVELTRLLSLANLGRQTGGDHAH